MGVGWFNVCTYISKSRKGSISYSSFWVIVWRGHCFIFMKSICEKSVGSLANSFMQEPSSCTPYEWSSLRQLRLNDCAWIKDTVNKVSIVIFYIISQLFRAFKLLRGEAFFFIWCRHDAILWRISFCFAWLWGWAIRMLVFFEVWVQRGVRYPWKISSL